MDDATKQGLDGWRLFPLHRSAGRESFSQILFRASGIPESKGDEESNLTIHQILRLAYADQRTPAPRLFRFEQWDTNNTRQAIGNLICGLNIYEEYEIQLALRGLTKSFEAKQKQLSLRLAAVPPEEGAATIETIESRWKALDEEGTKLRREIACQSACKFDPALSASKVDPRPARKPRMSCGAYDVWGGVSLVRR
jgi:hypothetical protein